MAAKLLLLALAGAAGTLTRYGTTLFVQRHTTGYFPWPTVSVNMLGCFLFGLIFAFAESRAGWSDQTRMILLTGFMGSFTTFSAFAYDSKVLIEKSEWLLLAGSILGQNLLGLALLFLGFWVGKLL